MPEKMLDPRIHVRFNDFMQNIMRLGPCIIRIIVFKRIEICRHIISLFVLFLQLYIINAVCNFFLFNVV